MSADPALGKYMPGAGIAVAYQSPALANNWRSHPDLPSMRGTFQPVNPVNVSIYVYPGLGDHLPGAAKAVDYQSPSLANHRASYAI